MLFYNNYMRKDAQLELIVQLNDQHHFQLDYTENYFRSVFCKERLFLLFDIFICEVTYHHQLCRKTC
jgi:hypothetical protein